MKKRLSFSSCFLLGGAFFFVVWHPTARRRLSQRGEDKKKGITPILTNKQKEQPQTRFFIQTLYSALNERRRRRRKRLDEKLEDYSHTSRSKLYSLSYSSRNVCFHVKPNDDDSRQDGCSIIIVFIIVQQSDSK